MTILILNACGGGGSGSAVLPQDTSLLNNVATPEAYLGSRDPALLGQGNVLDFVRILLGVSSVDELNALPTQPPSFGRAELPPGFMQVIGLMDRLAMPDLAGGRYQRTIVQPCLNQGVGTVTADDRLYSTQATSAFIYEFDNCQTDSLGSLTTGQVVLVTEPVAAVTGGMLQQSRVDLRDLRITSGDRDYSYSGSQGYQRMDRGFTNTGAADITVTATTHLSERNITSDKVNLIENLTRSLHSQQVSTIDGALLDHDLGSVKLVGSDDLRLAEGGDLLSHGEVLLHGASNSAATIKFLKQAQSGARYYVYLDDEGDGQYEAVAEINNEAESETGFTNDLSPKAVIIVDTGSGEDPRLGDRVVLHATESTDFDSAFDTLRLDWVLEEKPVESGLTLNIPSDNASSVNFFVDVTGDYKISLKVTDPEGHADLRVVSFTIVE